MWNVDNKCGPTKENIQHHSLLIYSKKEAHDRSLDLENVFPLDDQTFGSDIEHS